MTHLLIPGRHHVLTQFQYEYIDSLIQSKEEISTLLGRDGQPLGPTEPISDLIRAVTSANHHNTKLNPLANNRREAAITDLGTNLDVPSYVYHINDVGYVENFDEYVVKTINVESSNEEHQLQLTPDNTIVMCSTPEVATLYVQRGFKVLPAERSVLDQQHTAALPRQIMKQLEDISLIGEDPIKNPLIKQLMHQSSYDMYKKYNYSNLIKKIHQDRILLDNGDLTESRDYNTYSRSFDNGSERKYEQVKEDIVPGIIVDIGSCTGALLKEIALDGRFRESDLYGVEIVRSLFEESVHRKEQGAYGNHENIFFFQKNAIDSQVFPKGQVNTFTSFALTHEVYSYDSPEKLQQFGKQLVDQLAIGGKWINVDVVGPENPEEVVLADLRTDDGIELNILTLRTLIEEEEGAGTHTKLSAYLKSLSTYGRFIVFTMTFRKKQNEPRIQYKNRADTKGRIEIKMRDIAEFMSKKDYTDNWMSEMNERFCFWTPNQRKEFTESLGLKTTMTPIKNQWIIDNRLKGNITLYDRHDTTTPLDYPVTNVKIVAEKVAY